MNNFKKKVYVIINPVSGTKSKKGIPEKLTSFDAHKFDVHIFITRHEGHATQIASSAVSNGVDYVIAVGGDGTINEVAKVLVNTNTVFGIIPSGSGNGLARDLNIPLNINKAIKVLALNNIKNIDYGIANGNIFFCTCGVGFDAQVSEEVLNQSSRGKLMYAKSMLKVYYKFKAEKYKITTPDGTFEDDAFLVTCANASQYGNNGFIAPYADIQDGKMDIAILKPLSPLKLARTGIQLVCKNIRNNSRLVEIITSEACIEREKPGVMHLDGNAIQTEKDIYVKIVQQGLKVLVPLKAKEKKFDAQAFFTSITRWI